MNHNFDCLVVKFRKPKISVYDGGNPSKKEEVIHFHENCVWVSNATLLDFCGDDDGFDLFRAPKKVLGQGIACNE